ncbi:type VI secretion system Hcp family effector [Dyadobacter jejuensis]|uniref:Type VI secretion system Hcp family effector n=1 Tax=Dyadobacter jejuensis TaxID=1082580 RepID=A0A316AB39_9BACT|nr:type VI secretion system tube protein Hcp [Dyadobacter jejuensis]PWJ54782.1 type VI secretion system Hcp family effector [Dyadobacter jejuensis]
MKNYYTYFLLLCMLLLGSMSQAQGIYIYIPQVTSGSGLASPHADEVKLTSAQMSMDRPFDISTGVGGSREYASVNFTEYSLTKELDKSSAKIMKQIASGTVNPSIEIRYYNNTNEIVSRVELQKALVTSYSASSADYCSSCPPLSESFSIAFEEITVTHHENLKVKEKFNWNVVTSSGNNL